MIVLAALVAGCTALFVLSPLLGWRTAPAFEDEADAVRRAREELLARRQELLAGIKDLEMEYEVGKLTRSDYEASRDELTRQAVEVYRQMDRDGTS